MAQTVPAVQADVTDPAQVAAMFETAQTHFDAPITRW